MHILIHILNYIEKRSIIKMFIIKHYLWVDKVYILFFIFFPCLSIFLNFSAVKLYCLYDKEYGNVKKIMVLLNSRIMCKFFKTFKMYILLIKLRNYF